MWSRLVSRPNRRKRLGTVTTLYALKAKSNLIFTIYCMTICTKFIAFYNRNPRWKQLYFVLWGKEETRKFSITFFRYFEDKKNIFLNKHELITFRSEREMTWSTLVSRRERNILKIVQRSVFNGYVWWHSSKERMIFRNDSFLPKTVTIFVRILIFNY